MTYNVINLNPAKVTKAQKAVAYLRRTDRTVSMAALLATMRVLPDERIPTACTDGMDWIKYNPDYMESMPSTEAAAAIFVHETLHKFNLVHVRFNEWKKRHSTVDMRTLMKVFNMAQDYLINYSIKHDWQLPIQESWLYDPSYNMRTYTTEALADELLKQQQSAGSDDDGEGSPSDGSGDSGSSGNGSGESAPGDGGMEQGDDVCLPDPSTDDAGGEGGGGGAGSGTDASDPSQGLTEQQVRDMESKIKTDIARAARNSKGAGVGSSNFFQDQLEQEVKAPTASLKKEITRFASELTRSGHSSWYTPNRKRFLPNGFPMPGPRETKLGTVLAVIDVSGSTTGEAAQYFLNTVIDTFKSVPFKELIVLHHNTTVVKVMRFTDRQVRSGQVPTTIHCSGGTRLTPTFRWIKDNVKSKITAVVWLTDGDVMHSDVMEASRMWASKRFPLLWALFSNYGSVDAFINWVSVNMKFGRVSKLPQDKW